MELMVTEQHISHRWLRLKALFVMLTLLLYINLYSPTSGSKEK